MDNFFDILIVLFFIGSLLAPLFKKKKTDAPYENPNIPRQREQRPGPERYSGASTDDLLGELEELFGKKKESRLPTDYEHTPIITKPESGQRDSEIDYDKDQSYDSAPSLETEIDKRRSEIERINRETRDIMASTARTRKEASVKFSDSQFNKKDEIKTIYETTMVPVYSRKRLLSNLKDPETLKDYIIISELIGKPKALKHSR
jgi:hypothetical protein